MQHKAMYNVDNNVYHLDSPVAIRHHQSLGHEIHFKAVPVCFAPQQAFTGPLKPSYSYLTELVSIRSTASLSNFVQVDILLSALLKSFFLKSLIKLLSEKHSFFSLLLQCCSYCNKLDVTTVRTCKLIPCPLFLLLLGFCFCCSLMPRWMSCHQSLSSGATAMQQLCTLRTESICEYQTTC